MEFPNMIGDPSQKNPASIFGFESYPGQPTNVTYPENMQDPKLFNHLPSPNSNFLPFQTFPSTEVPSSFSFGAPKDSQVVATTPFAFTSGGFGEQKRFNLGKRKMDIEPFQPCKQLITEEKMAEHMSRLHISSETSTPLEPESVKNKRLYMCEEMRKLQSDPILPHSLLAHMQQPCTALVLWKPPTRMLPTLGLSEDDQLKKHSQAETEEEESSIANDTLEIVEMDNDCSGVMDLDT